jgi:hypothetical protein
MRKRAVTLLLAVVTAGALVTAAGTAGASVAAKAKPALCAGKTKKAAVKAIKAAYNNFISGHPYSLADTQHAETFVQFLSGPKTNAALKAQFEASALALQAQSTGTTLQINSVKCTGKKTAGVDFDYVIGGKPLTGVAPKGSTAILDGKQWKVTAATLCNVEAGSDPTVIDHDPCLTIINS